MGSEFSSTGGGGAKKGGDADKEKKRKWEPPAPPPRIGKKQRKRDAKAGIGSKIPTVTPNAKCKLRMLKLERIKDYLLLEEEFVSNQVRARSAAPLASGVQLASLRVVARARTACAAPAQLWRCHSEAPTTSV